MPNLNKIILIGRLTADPELRYTVDGTPLTKMSLAVNRDPNPGVDFVNIIAWRRLAEVCGQYLKKGSLVLFEGRIQVRSYDDQSGKRRWATEIVTQRMKMLEKKGTRDEAPPDILPKDSDNFPPSEEIPLPAEVPLEDDNVPVLEGEDLPF